MNIHIAYVIDSCASSVVVSSIIYTFLQHWKYNIDGTLAFSKQTSILCHEKIITYSFLGLFKIGDLRKWNYFNVNNSKQIFLSITLTERSLCTRYNILT